MLTYSGGVIANPMCEELEGTFTHLRISRTVVYIWVSSRDIVSLIFASEVYLIKSFALQVQYLCHIGESQYIKLMKVWQKATVKDRLGQ